MNSVRDVTERLYYVFLCAYVNGIKAHMRRVDTSSGDDPGTEAHNWKKAVEEGENAVAAASQGWQTDNQEKALDAVSSLKSRLVHPDS
jgi:hypothetical protein